MKAPYIVRLTDVERNELRKLVSGGKARVRRVKRAQVLQAADRGETDAAVAGSVKPAAFYEAFRPSWPGSYFDGWNFNSCPNMRAGKTWWRSRSACWCASALTNAYRTGKRSRAKWCTGNDDETTWGLR